MRWFGGLAAAVLLLAGCASASSSHLHFGPAPPRYAACLSQDCGAFGARMSWSGVTIAGMTGWYVYLNGVQIADVSQPAYTYYGADCGTSFTLSVRAHDAQGATGPAYSSSYAAPPCHTTATTTTTTSSAGGATVVGVAAAPAPSCTVTVGSVSAAASDLASATAGSTVCLSAGTYGAMTISSSVTQNPGVTFAAATPGAATIIGITSTAQVSNLTIEGFDFTGSVAFHEGDLNDTVQDNNIQNFSGYAVESCNSCVNNGFISNGLTVRYNQIDHTAYCLRYAGTGTMENITFSHNVCGPGIGAGGSSDNHYTQTECVSGLTIDNNAFEGPFNAASLSAGAHNNVSHACGSGFQFNNNIVWHSDSRAQELLWGDDGSVSTAQAENNLIVQDPSCGATCPAIAMWLDGNGSSNTDSNVTFSNNTVIGSNDAQATTGGLFSRAGGISGFTVQDNISVNNNAAGVGDYSLGTCNTCDHNVSQDASASGAGSVTGWAPSWQATSWTPTNGSPWSAPPAGYYKPNTGGGVLSTMGYQGTIGP